MKTLIIFCFVMGIVMVAVSLILCVIYGVKNTRLGELENTPENASTIEEVEEELRKYLIAIIVLACCGVIVIFAAVCLIFFRVRRGRRSRGLHRQASIHRREPPPGIHHVELEEDAVAPQGPRPARVQQRRVAVDGREENGENVPEAEEPAVDQQARNEQGVGADDLPPVDN